MSLDDRLIAGRPHGGMSVLWNKSLSNSFKTIQYDDNRIGIEIKSNSSTFLFLSVYLPFECDMFYDGFCFYLSKLQSIIVSSNTLYVFILGAVFIQNCGHGGTAYYIYSQCHYLSYALAICNLYFIPFEYILFNCIVMNYFYTLF